MFNNITLEVSLKSFKKTDDEYIRSVCAKIFDQWRALLKDRKSISVMLWTADGSELLDYAGNLEDEFEWCRFLGTANLPYLAEDGPKETSLHHFKQDYIKNAPKMTYTILKKIVTYLKEEAAKQFPNALFRVGETFDIGPEFAISDFKYNRHTEISIGAAELDRFGFIDATAKLSGDTRPYAAYPNGIPDGTPFGTFLGKQTAAFFKDMGFDYLWLSNGLGFSANPWDLTGKIFDGKCYYPEKLEKTKQQVFDFWRLFREACPNVPLETRGTNNSVGIDYASDGVPLYDIYNADLDIIAPPNSPWAAINDNFGLEIMGHMTRCCELPPNKVFPFRYYLHDPWWVNSPWYDRYDGTPCDIYLPMAISRITPEGKVESANSLNILTIDTSFGEMPVVCANESIPHFLKAEKNVSTDPAPFVWVYPMREYTTSKDGELLEEMHKGDNYICDAINDGFPLCCVASTDSFLNHQSALYRNSVLISPVPENPEVLKKLTDFANQGINVIFYGSDKKLKTLPDFENQIKLDINAPVSKLREVAATLGYSITFEKKNEAAKPPTMAISRDDNAHFFSVYNTNTTTKSILKMPLGAPILIGAEAEIEDNTSAYHFARSEHRECRAFIEQKGGVITCREAPPVNAKFRRAIRIGGLEDATVCLFGEKGCELAVSCAQTTDFSPEFDPRFTLVNDEKYGTYLKGEHISGQIYFLMGYRNAK